MNKITAFARERFAGYAAPFSHDSFLKALDRRLSDFADHIIDEVANSDSHDINSFAQWRPLDINITAMNWANVPAIEAERSLQMQKMASDIHAGLPVDHSYRLDSFSCIQNLPGFKRLVETGKQMGLQFELGDPLPGGRVVLFLRVENSPKNIGITNFRQWLAAYNAQIIEPVKQSPLMLGHG